MEVKEENHQEGLVEHSMGWPLSDGTGGGSFLLLKMALSFHLSQFL